MENDELFGDVISSYSRRQAIEDGVLVQLSGPGYEGDQWVPDMVKEAGFKLPVAMTSAAFFKCVTPESGNLPAGQHAKGRLWDVLWMLRWAIKRAPAPCDRVKFVVHVREDEAELPPRAVKMWSLCGPGDTPEPVITIMLHDED